MTAGRDGEDALSFVVRERHLFVREEPNEIREQPSRHHDARIALDVSAQRRADRYLHIGCREGESIAVRLQEDAAEHLHRATGRDGSRNDRERRGEGSPFEHVMRRAEADTMSVLMIERKDSS